MTGVRSVNVVEVGPRDGFQPIGVFIPTETKQAFIERLYRAGVRRMEITAFVKEAAVPQLADAVSVLEFATGLPDFDPQVLVPNLRYAEMALRAGAQHLAFVVSVSEKHNQNNVRRSVTESVAEFERVMRILPPDVKMRLNLATAFDCPFDGLMDFSSVLALMERIIEVVGDAEVALCDTTGRVTPNRVSELFMSAKSRYSTVAGWAFHGHDTYGAGISNVVAAVHAGINVIDASFGGLGGCPFAPGATGNVATEDVVWMLEGMGDLNRHQSYTTYHHRRRWRVAPRC